MPIQLEASWLEVLAAEFEKEYMISLKSFLNEEKKQGYTIYPKSSDIFAAFEHSPFSKTKVVILGQDPYHGPGQAHGLSFSVPRGQKIPPSLQNMYKELARDTGFVIPAHGNLELWAGQ